MGSPGRFWAEYVYSAPSSLSRSEYIIIWYLSETVQLEYSPYTHGVSIFLLPKIGLACLTYPFFRLCTALGLLNDEGRVQILSESKRCLGGETPM